MTLHFDSFLCLGETGAMGLRGKVGAVGANGEKGKFFLQLIEMVLSIVRDHKMYRFILISITLTLFSAVKVIAVKMVCRA